MVEEEITRLAPEFEHMPGVIVIHDINGFKPIYMSKNGLDLLGITLEELIAVGENYQNLYFNESFMGNYLEQLNKMIAREGNNETFTFFHQVKIQEEFEWYAASIKVFQTREFKPTHTITYAVPLNDHEWTIKRAEGLLYEKSFAQKNMRKFLKLSTREKEVLCFSAAGKKTSQIAEELGVSQDTINSHLKSIKSKLQSTSSYELLKYAKAYDLI